MSGKANYFLIAVIVFVFFTSISYADSNSSTVNTKIIEKILNDMENRNIEQSAKYWAVDIEWVVKGQPAKIPFAGTYSGKDRLEKYFYTFYTYFILSDLIIESIAETKSNYVESFIRLQGHISTTGKKVDIQFLYTWQFNTEKQISRVIVSFVAASLELAFASGGKGTIISNYKTSPEAVAISNSYLNLKPVVITATIDYIRSFFTTPNTPPAGAIIEKVNINGIEGEITRTADSRSDKIILQMHGGAFMTSIAGRYRIFNYAIVSEIKIPILSVNYRLAPENPFPAGLDDCLAVYKGLLKQYKPEDIIFEGESSGGNFVFALMLYVRDHNLPLPGAGIAISPWLDLTNSGETMVINAERDYSLSRAYLKRCADWYLQDAFAKNPIASPLFGDMTGFPPVYITVGDSEVLLTDAVTMFNKLSSKGIHVTIEMSPLIHSWPTVCKGLIDSQRTIERFCKFLRNELNIQ